MLSWVSFPKTRHQTDTAHWLSRRDRKAHISPVHRNCFASFLPGLDPACYLKLTKVSTLWTQGRVLSLRMNDVDHGAGSAGEHDKSTWGPCLQPSQKHGVESQRGKSKQMLCHLTVFGFLSLFLLAPNTGHHNLDCRRHPYVYYKWDPRHLPSVTIKLTFWNSTGKMESKKERKKKKGRKKGMCPVKEQTWFISCQSPRWECEGLKLSAQHSPRKVTTPGQLQSFPVNCHLK